MQLFGCYYEHWRPWGQKTPHKFSASSAKIKGLGRKKESFYDRAK